MIYFIGNKEYDWVKIGFSHNPNTRLDGIQTGCPVELTIFYTHPGAQRVERKLHELFKDSHLRGEWFRLSGSVQEYIDSGKPLVLYTRMDTLLANTTLKDRIISLHEQGLPIHEIASTLDISKSSVSKVINQHKIDKEDRSKLDARMYKKLGM